MASRNDPDLFTFLAAIVFLALLISLALVVTPYILISIPAFIGYRLYIDSPARHERIAKADTMAFLGHAQAKVIEFDDDEVEDLLTATWPRDMPTSLRVQLLDVAWQLLDDEGLLDEIPPPPALHNTVEAARYRDQLARLGQVRNDPELTYTAIETIGQALEPVASAVPALAGDVQVSVAQFLAPLGDRIEKIVSPFFLEADYHLFGSLKARLDANLQATNKNDPIYPRSYKGDDIVDTYLKGTRLLDVFSLKTPFAIPEERRFEHAHIVAGSGHGKTQTLQYLIHEDLPAIAAGEKSVVVIDSQGDLINTILAAKHLPPERIVLIDPEDIAWPVSLNLFSVGQERLASYDLLERERLTNSIIELYDFVLGSLLSAGMTAKQSVVFRYVTRLMFHIPNATIHTLRELMEPDGATAYAEHVSKLDGTARRFFETEFNSKEFANTKTQVLRRLYGILENQTFERMFSHPQSKFDMFTELNSGKLILINTAKSLLKEQGTEIFGRFFIALIAQSVQERATVHALDRLPVFVYIDEAQDYFDPNVGVILSQARKYNVGMTIAHQYLGQLSSGLQEAIEANTSIKLAGGVSSRDARSLSGQMNTDAKFIETQPKGTFATHIRGLTETAVPLSFPFFVLEREAQATKDEVAAIRSHSRQQYAEPWQASVDHTDHSDTDDEEPVEEKPPHDPAEPSDEL